jgi:hypothetical protein
VELGWKVTAALAKDRFTCGEPFASLTPWIAPISFTVASSAGLGSSSSAWC